MGISVPQYRLLHPYILGIAIWMPHSIGRAEFRRKSAFVYKIFKFFIANVPRIDFGAGSSSAHW